MSKVTNTPRGIRNNNPFNIRHNPANAWEGMAERQTDPDFVQFTDIVYGIRAGVRLFRNYRTLYGCRTVAEIIARHAPPSENDTDAFVQFVCARLGVRPDDPLDLDDEDLLINLAEAVIHFENAGYEVPRDVVAKGVQMALRPRTIVRAAQTDTGTGSLAATVPTAATGALAAILPHVAGLDWRVAAIAVVVVAVVAVGGVLLWRSRRD